MRLDSIEVSGFKSIRELQKLALRPLNVMIGANGAGKSNLIALFQLLNQMVMGNFQTFVRQHGGADTFLYFGQKTTAKITVKLTFGKNAYACVWMPTVDDRLFFAEENCIFYGDYASQAERSLGSGQLESNLPQAVQEKRWRPFYYVLDGLKSWRVYHFHDTSDSAPLKKIGDINDNRYLRPNAGNLAAFLYRLQQSQRSHYEAIRDTVRLVAPFFDDFILRPLPENENKIRLEWREPGSDYPFMAHHLSDGTLRFICLATLLLQPRLPATILIDEPELGLHPYAIGVLASLMRSAAAKKQLIVSTQSVTLVNQFEPEDLLIVENRDRATVIERVDPARLSEWLEDYALGELWEKNVLGGRPTR
ncbi:MAG: AAA family ATPase [Chloroflexota bacterium]|nr:AAA family ATPase [Chloroflexota bacterium]